MDSPKFKPTISLDFDGVLHSYEKGWQDGKIYGTVTDGFFEWAEKAHRYFKLVIFSSRCENEKSISEMVEWLIRQHTIWCVKNNKDIADSPLHFDFPIHKPKAWVTIDDRAIQFKGSWATPELDPEALIKFKPWNSTENGS